MFRKLNKEINLKKFFWAAAAVFSVNMIFGFLERKLWFYKYAEQFSVSIFRSSNEDLIVNWVWNVTGHVIYAMFVPFACISWTDGKDISDGLKAGLVMAFVQASLLLMMAPLIAFPWLFNFVVISQIFLLAACSGMLAVKIYYWEKIGS